MKYQKLISEFEMNLDVLESRTDDILHMAEHGISRTEKCIKLLRQKVVEMGFSNTEEEICFFKHKAPNIQQAHLLCQIVQYRKQTIAFGKHSVLLEKTLNIWVQN